MNELLIFAKYPEPEKVKTRLAKSLGAVEAAHRYRDMVETVIRKTSPLNGEYHRTLYFDPPGRGPDFMKWLSLEIRPQSSGDLGQRMLNAFQTSFANGCKRAVVIGTDCVELERSLLCDAFARLKEADLVIGPAEDGGYYLIGMKKTHPSLFEDIPWSTGKVLHETLEKAKGADLTVDLLKTLSDLDEEF